MTVTAFVYTPNSTVLMNEHGTWNGMAFFGLSLTHAAHSNSSLISELLNCLVIAIQHKLFVGTVSFLLSNDGIKLLISDIVPMYIPLRPFFLRSRG